MRHRVSLLALTMLLIASSFLSLSAQNGPQLLPADKLAKLLPATVFLDAENVPTQGRNASGVYLDGKLAIISLIDTTGYSSAYQEKYSGVILTQGKLTIGSETLAPGT